MQATGPSVTVAVGTDEKSDSSSALTGRGQAPSAASMAQPETDLLKSDMLLGKLKLMERLVNQNAENDLFFKVRAFLSCSTSSMLACLLG